MSKSKFNSEVLLVGKVSEMEVEKMLSILPKKCSCSACESVKASARQTLGEKKYNTTLNLFKIFR